MPLGKRLEGLGKLKVPLGKRVEGLGNFKVPLGKRAEGLGKFKVPLGKRAEAHSPAVRSNLTGGECFRVPLGNTQWYRNSVVL